MEKRVTIAGGLNRHITRVQWVDGKLVVWVPQNANPELTLNNVELVSREFANSDGQKRTLSLQEAVNKRIKDAKIKPRRGQTRSLEIIFSGSHEVMCNMSKKDLLKWAKDTLEWAQNTWGKENVVSASLHLDEKTPHIHMIVVPIVQGQSRRSKKQRELDKERGIKRETYKINTEKLRLCANEVYTTPLLYYYHDHYALEVSNKYGLERGLRAEPGSKKKHQTSEDYNRQLAAEAAEKRFIIAEIQADYKITYKKKEDIELDVKNLENKSSSISEEISDKTTKLETLGTLIQEQQAAVTKNKGIIDRQIENWNARKEELENQKATIDANSATISDQNDQLMYNEQQLGIYREIGTSIENRQEQLRALSSRGLQKLIEDIPNMIKKDVQELVNRVWNGKVISFEECDVKVGGVPQKFIRINMQNGGTKYEFEVQESNGHIWKDGKWCTYRDSTKEVYMPELAAYFRQELLPETKEFVKSMYKVEVPTKTVGQEQEEKVVWTCNIGINDCRIIQKPDGVYHLQKKEWDTSKVDENGKYYVPIWTKTKGFSSFKVLNTDSNYAYLKIQHKNRNIEYVNQYGINLSSKQLSRLGIKSSNGISR